MKTDADSPLFAFPAGVVEGRAILRAMPSVPWGLRGLVLFRRVRGISADRALYVADRPIEDLRGQFEFTTENGRTIGTYRPSEWVAKVRDFRPSAPKRDEDPVAPIDGLSVRLGRLLNPR